MIANAARTMPHTLRSLKIDDETIAELTVMSGFDDDLAQQITATSNRIRGLLTQIHPALERVLGPRLDHPAVLDLLETCPTPGALTAAGKTRVRSRLLKRAPRLGGRLTEEIFAAVAAQTVVVTGTNAAGIVLPRLAAQLAALRQQRAEVAEKVEELVAAHPLSKVLTTMPGVGVRTLRTHPHRGRRQGLPDRRAPGLLRLAWPPSPADPGSPSAENTHPAAATRSSNEPCSSPRSPP